MKRSCLPRQRLCLNCCGQSLVESVVVLALVAILVTTLVKGIGQSSVQWLQATNEAMQERSVAGATGGNGANPDTAAGGGAETGREGGLTNGISFAP